MRLRFAKALIALFGACLLVGCATQKPEQEIAADLTSSQLKKQKLKKPIGDAAAAMPTSIVATVPPNHRLAQSAANVPLPNFRERALNQLAYSENIPDLSNESYAARAIDKSVVLERGTPQVDALIKKYANTYEIPESLVRRVVKRESNGDPSARNGPYWGLMQISHPTAKKMGYVGYPAGLLDAETNLRYAVKYLAGAYLVAKRDQAKAVRFYERGYYYEAKSQNVLKETGLNGKASSVVNSEQVEARDNSGSFNLNNISPASEPASGGATVQMAAFLVKSESADLSGINNKIAENYTDTTIKTGENFVFPAIMNVVPIPKPVE